MARTPNRTKMGDNYANGGIAGGSGKRRSKARRKNPKAYGEHGMKMQYGGKKVGSTIPYIGKKSGEALDVVNPRRESKFAQHAPWFDWMKKGSVSPRPFYEPTTKTFFPRLQNLGHEIQKTLRGEGDSMAIQYEHGGPMERSTRNQGNQSLMGGNVEQHD